MRASSLLLTSAVVFVASACQAAAAGKTLDETLAFIRDAIAYEGKVNYTAAMHDAADNSDWSQTMTSDATNVKYDKAACSVSFHWVTTLEGQVKQDLDSVIFFGRGKNVSVTNREQEIREQVAAAGHPSWTAIVTPAIWVVTMTMTDTSNVINFTNQEKAQKVARAIDHAMELCGAPKDGF